MEQTYCLTPAEWRYAQGCLTLAKRLGLIEDDTPAALEARRAAKNAEISRSEEHTSELQSHSFISYAGLPAICSDPL